MDEHHRCTRVQHGDPPAASTPALRSAAR